MNGQTTTRIHDLGLAAALVSCGFQIQEISRDAEGRAYFVFQQSDELGITVVSYWENSLEVKARTFFDNTKMLKSRIYSER
ncbi:MAG TPA: DUF5659 domain-containing protein [Candidatus Saccharimonadales bacterium]|nr:DUF5659 domain-containing protein [Candidatus Saccharimonadales bacterium]